MKYIMVIPDGLTDFCLKKKIKKTPLDEANIPYIDTLLQNGLTGTVKTIPNNMSPGSDVANLSLLGVNPRSFIMGRGAIEALARDIKLNKNQTAFRANFVTIKNDLMVDYTGGDIKNKNAGELVKLLNNHFDNSITFYHGVSYRNIAIINKSNLKLQTEPPHNILDKKIQSYLPSGRDGALIRNIMQQASIVLNNSAYLKKKKLKANSIWLWGEGHVKCGDSFYKRHHLKGAVISAVDIIRGIAKFLKMDVINVPGITGDFNTNFENKAKYALKNIDKYDFIYVHVEATDEAGHKGDFQEKKKAIEKIDQLIVKPLLKSNKKFNIILIPDHPTPIKLRTHIDEEVPFIIYSKYKTLTPNHQFRHYSEQILRKSPITIKKGHKFLEQVKNWV